MERAHAYPIVEKDRKVRYNFFDVSGRLAEISELYKMSKEKPSHIEYPDELKLREVLNEGLPMLIPREYLFGRQEKESYDKRKRNAVEFNLRNEGRAFLLKNPIIVCSMTGINPDAMSLVIVDGHHRTRYSSAFGIQDIPSIIYTPEQIVNAMNIKNKTNLDAGSLTSQLNIEVAEAMASFRNLPPNKNPKIFFGARSTNQLPFARFSLLN